jgi:hypothetical protein
LLHCERCQMQKYPGWKEKSFNITTTSYVNVIPDSQVHSHWLTVSICLCRHLEIKISKMRPTIDGCTNTLSALSLYLHPMVCWDLLMWPHHWLCFSTGLIIGAHLNAPGSWHNSCVAQPIYWQLLHDTPAGFYLVVV